jgi:ABC-type antimicrobial peptide transport system permease subunit
MKKNLFCFIFTVLIFSSLQVHSQVNYDLYPFLNQIPAPPLNCEEAKNLRTGDSSTSNYTSFESLDTLGKFFDNIHDKLTLNSENIKKYFTERDEERKDEPGGKYRGEMQAPHEMSEIIDDMHKADELMIRINEDEQQFRNEALEKQNKVNKEIKKADKNDIVAKRKIVDEFLNNINEMYNKFAIRFNQNFKQLDEISGKYRNSIEMKKPFIEKKVIEMQLIEVENLRLLLSCVKGSIEIGSKYFKN